MNGQDKEFARQAGIEFAYDPTETPMPAFVDVECWEDEMQKFANLIRADEREACAKVADGWPDYDVQGLAEAIRARGNI